MSSWKRRREHLTRRERSARNKAAWQSGVRWSGDNGCPSAVADAIEPAQATAAEVAEQQLILAAYAPSAVAEHGGQPATNGVVYSTAAWRVYATLRDRLAAAAQADTPDQARRLAGEVAWPCRCGIAGLPMPMLRTVGWHGRLIVCGKCGRTCR